MKDNEFCNLLAAVRARIPDWIPQESLAMYHERWGVKTAIRIELGSQRHYIAENSTVQQAADEIAFLAEEERKRIRQLARLWGLLKD